MEDFEKRALEVALDWKSIYPDTAAELLARCLASLLDARREGMGCVTKQILVSRDRPDAVATFDVKVGPRWFRVRISDFGSD